MQASDRTIAEYSAWMRDVRKLTPTTIYFYDTLVKFVEFVDHTPWHLVTSAMVERFMQRPRRGGIAPSAATMDRDRVSLQVFFRYLMGRGVLTENPIMDVGVPKVRNRLPKALSDDELLALLGVDSEPADQAWLGLGAFCGLRRHEMTALEVTSLRDGEISRMLRKGRVPANIEYTQLALAIGEGIKDQPLMAASQLVLERIEELRCLRLKYGARFLLPWDQPAGERVRLQCGLEDPELPNPGVLNKRLARIAKRAGVKVTVHSLRHTAATNLFRAGVPAPIIQDQLGHTSWDTTMIYLKTSGMLAQWRAQRPQG